jgi:hypothetical protein
MDQDELLKFAIDLLEGLPVPYAIVGSWGSSVYGEARFTRDIDIIIDLTHGNVDAFCRGFPRPDFYLSESAVREAVKSRFHFNVLHPSSGGKIDFMLARTDSWHKHELQRRRRLQFRFGESSFQGYAAAPEDVILGKLWFYSDGAGDHHLRDIAGILRVTGVGVDRDYVERWADDLGYWEAWQKAVALADSP